MIIFPCYYYRMAAVSLTYVLEVLYFCVVFLPDPKQYKFIEERFLYIMELPDRLGLCFANEVV